MAFSFAADVSALSLTSVRFLADSLGLPPVTQDHDSTGQMTSSIVTEGTLSDRLSSSSLNTNSSTSTPTSHMKHASSESVSPSETQSDSTTLCAAVEKYKLNQCDNASLVNATTSDEVEKGGSKGQGEGSSVVPKDEHGKTKTCDDSSEEKGESLGVIEDRLQEESLVKYKKHGGNGGRHGSHDENFASGNNGNHLHVWGNPLSDSTLRLTLNSMRKNCLLCDVKIVCHDTVFTAHCAVLVGFSNFLAALISRACRKERDPFLKRDVEDLPKFYTKGARVLSEDNFKKDNCARTCETDSVASEMYQNIQIVSQAKDLLQKSMLDGDESRCDNDFDTDMESSAVVVFRIVQDNVNGLCVSMGEDNMTATQTNCSKYSRNNSHVFTIDSCINECITSVCSPVQTNQSADTDVAGMIKATSFNCTSCPGFLPSLPSEVHLLSRLDLPPLPSQLDIPSLSSSQVESPKLSLPCIKLARSNSSSQEHIPSALSPLDLSSLPSGNRDAVQKTLAFSSLSPVTPVSTSHSSSDILSSKDDSRMDCTDFSTPSAHLHVTASEEFSTVRSTKSTISVRRFTISPCTPTRSLIFTRDKHSVSGSLRGSLQSPKLCESERFVLHASTKQEGSLQLSSMKICTEPHNQDGKTVLQTENPREQQMRLNPQDSALETKEKDNQDDLMSINVSITEPAVLDVLLDYAYTGHFKKLQHLPVTKYSEVNYAARKMEVDVNVFTPKVIRQALSSKNFLDLWDLAEYSHNRSLVDLVAKYVAKRLDTLWMSCELPRLTYQRMVTTLVIASRRLSTKENVILRSILSWLKKDLMRRSRAIKVFMPFIQRSEISEGYALQLLRHDDIIQCIPLLRAELLDRVKKADTAPCAMEGLSDQTSAVTGSSKRSSSKGASSKDASRCSSTVHKRASSLSAKPVFTRLPLTKRRPQTHVEHDDIPSDISRLSLPSSQATTLEKHFSDFSLTPRSTKLRRPVKRGPCETPSLVIVGEDTLSSELIMLTLNACQQDIVGEPIHLKVLHENQQTITFFDGYVILVGGERNYKREKIQSVTVCDIRSNWRASLPDMHLPRSNSAVFLIDSTLYVTGGEGRYYEALSQVESLEMRGKKLKWKIMACMKSKRSGHSIVRDEDGCAYVVGGGTNKCERYVPTVEKWFDVPSLPQEFSELRPLLAIVDRKLIAVNYYRPSRIYVLDLDDDACVWRAERLTGVQPNWIVSIASWKDTVYVLEEKLQMIYSFTYEQKHWEPGAKLVRAQFKPLFIAMKVSPTANAKQGLEQGIVND